MKRYLAAWLPIAFVATALSGCIVHTNPGHTVVRNGPPAREGCRPSQHWEDGHCVHNGKGRGARKHDD